MKGEIKKLLSKLKKNQLMIVYKHRTAEPCVKTVEMHTKMYPFKARGTHVSSPVLCFFLSLFTKIPELGYAFTIGH